MGKVDLSIFSRQIRASSPVLDRWVALAEEIKQLGAGKVLIVTDQGLVAAGLAQRLGDLLDEAGLSWSLYDKVEPEPRYETAAEVVEAARGVGAKVPVKPSWRAACWLAWPLPTRA